MEKVRGDQTSVVGYTRVQLCRVCDSALIQTLERSKAPLPPDAMPVTSRHAWHAETRPLGEPPEQEKPHELRRPPS